MAKDADFMLTPEERQTRARKRKRLMLVLLLLLVLAIGAYLGARPTSNAIKGWQARRHAQKAFAFIEEEKWKEAQEAALAAYQLRRSEPEALRAVARFLSRTGQPQALPYWDNLKNRQSLNREDLRDEATIALVAGDRSRAENTVGALISTGDATAADWILAAQLAVRKGSGDDLQTAVQKVQSDPRAGERAQFQAALLVLGFESARAADSESEKRQREAWARIQALSKGTTQPALEALVVLSQRALAPPSDSPLDASFVGPDELSKMIERHPFAKAAEKLLAFDLQMLAKPEERMELIQRAVEAWKRAEAPALANLAAWLNGKGEFQLQLDTIPLESAVQSRDLFLQHVDALGALGRWEDIRKLLEAERFPLEPTIRHMYLARCHAQLQQKTAAENNWQRALEAAAGDVSKLMTLADYAGKNGASHVAESAYAAAATLAPKFRPAQQGRLRAAEAQRDTRKIHAILTGMLEIWPDDIAIQNDELYTRLLLLPDDSTLEDLQSVETPAQALVSRNPSGLPHRSLLALSRLKQKRPAEALQVYEGVQAPQSVLTSAALTIHAAVLAANGKTDDAQDILRQVKPDQLLPEERALFETL